MSKNQNRGFTAADAVWLQGLMDDWDKKDAMQELEKCMATATSAISHTARMKVTALDIEKRRAVSPENFTVTGIFMDMAERRAYELEKSENPRDVRVGRAMAAELHRRYSD